MKPRVCVADATIVFRSAVRGVLLREQEFAVLEASDLAGLEAAVEVGIDIALIDETLPPAGALPAVEACVGRSDVIIVWSLSPERSSVLAAIRAGATGYLRKEISAEGLLRSLRGASRGESPLSRDLAALMIEAMHESEGTQRIRELVALLSERELEVLGQLALGARNRQIGAALTISEFTVKRHVQNILSKLGVRSRREAAAFYRSVSAALPSDGERPQ